MDNKLEQDEVFCAIKQNMQFLNYLNYVVQYNYGPILGLKAGYSTSFESIERKRHIKFAVSKMLSGHPDESLTLVTFSITRLPYKNELDYFSLIEYENIKQVRFDMSWREWDNESLATLNLELNRLTKLLKSDLYPVIEGTIWLDEYYLRRP